jgi:hypothetical protein
MFLLQLLCLSVVCASVPAGHSLVWSDEFDVDAVVAEQGNFLLGSKWYALDSCLACNTNNLFTSRPSNVRVRGGNLELIARVESGSSRHGKTFPYTSGAVQSYCGPTTGEWCRDGGMLAYNYNVRNLGSWTGNVSTYLEVKAKIPPGKLWPAIW